MTVRTEPPSGREPRVNPADLVANNPPVPDAGPPGEERQIGIAVAILLVLVFGLISWAVAGFPSILQPFLGDGAIATLGVKARTESLSFEPAAGRDHVWVLPPGTYSIVLPEDPAACKGEDGDFCTLVTRTSTLLVVSGESRLELTVTGLGLAVGVLPREPGAFTAEVRDAAGTLARTSSLLTFETAAPGFSLRLPLILERATLGSDLYENVSLAPEGGDAWQPMLLDGSFLVVAGAGDEHSRESFTVLEGVIDPGDVVELGRNCGAGTGGNAEAVQAGAIRGVATVDGAGGESRPVIAVNLNTCVPIGTLSHTLPGVAVRRFGATSPSTLSVPSQWVVFGRWPPWVSFWLTFLACMAVVQIVSSIAGFKPSARTRRWFGGVEPRPTPAGPPPQGPGTGTAGSPAAPVVMPQGLPPALTKEEDQ